MLTWGKPEITVISPVNNYCPICANKYPICQSKPAWSLTLYDMETQYSKDYMEMKIKRTLREMIQSFLGKHFEKYRKETPTVMDNLYDMESW